MSKPLTAPSVLKELKFFGLDEESAGHNPINSLSGGQKVKVVLAGAMWQNPHILILDEPTNYLDRDGFFWASGTGCVLIQIRIIRLRFFQTPPVPVPHSPL